MGAPPSHPTLVYSCPRPSRQHSRNLPRPGASPPGRAPLAGRWLQVGPAYRPDFLSGGSAVQGTQGASFRAPAARGNSLGTGLPAAGFRPVLSELREATSSGKVGCVVQPNSWRKNRAWLEWDVCGTDDGLLVPRVLSSNLCCCGPLCQAGWTCQPQLPAPPKAGFFFSF